MTPVRCPNGRPHGAHRWGNGLVCNGTYSVPSTGGRRR